MEQKLTAQIAASYFGAKVQIYLHGTYARTVPVNGYLIARIQHHPMHGECEYKLLLTPLSKIREEDAIYVAKIANVNWNTRNEMFGYDFSNYITIGRDICHTIDSGLADMLYIRFCNLIEIIDYLRSKSYDLGYGSIKSLIEAGIALDETSHNN